MLQCKMQLAVLYTAPLYFRGVMHQNLCVTPFRLQPTLKNFVRLIDSDLTVFTVHGKKLRNVSAHY